MAIANREAWLKERRTGLGGSDAAAACGMSQWKTPLELWLDKRGELETAENEPMRWGNLLEPVIRQEYANRTGREVVVPPGILRHPTIGFLFMTPDGIADASRVLQVKTSRTAEGWGEPGTDDIPTEYVFQTQHEMFVTGLPVADVAVLIGGSDFRIYEIPADREFQEMLLEHEAEFWRLVESGETPEAVSREDVKRRWQVCRGSKVAATSEVSAAVEELRSLKETMKLDADRIEELSAFIQSHMKDAAELVSPQGSTLATWKSVKASSRFDTERFKAEQPHIFSQYLSPPKPQRRFLLKSKGE